MSTKHLRRKLIEAEQAEKSETPSRDLSESNLAIDDAEVETDVSPEHMTVAADTVKPNLFALLNEEDGLNDGIQTDQLSPTDVKPVGGQRKKKSKNRKKKANKKKTDASAEEEDFDAVLQAYGSPSVDQSGVDANCGPEHLLLLSETELFRVDFRNLDPDIELRRMIGQKVGDGGGASQQSSARKRTLGGKLVRPKNTWPLLRGCGLSMVCVNDLPSGVKEFSFEHNANYQFAQNLFWEAMDGLSHDALAAILREYPYHIDTLLQLADAMRMNEDYQQGRDLIERALYACEAALHPLFNVTTYRCRLDYRQQENRPFFLALWRRVNDLANGGQFRTALETAKMLYSVCPDEDPWAMLLLIDFLALRARQYDYLLQLYTGLEASRNLSQLPNFCYSTALALFLKLKEQSTKDDAVVFDAADDRLREALLKFPTMLLALLDACSVEPDAEVAKCPAFQPNEQFADSSGLKQLTALYAARCAPLWKEPMTMAWLERNVRQLLDELPPKAQSDPALLVQFRQIRRSRYKGTPRNILRHVLCSELKKAIAELPAEVRELTLLGHDPLPPTDSRCRYERPAARSRRLGSDGFLTAFLRSLMPNYDPDAVADPEGDEAVVEAAQGGGVHGAARDLANALRQLMNNVQLIPPPGAQPPHDQQGPHFDPNDLD